MLEVVGDVCGRQLADGAGVGIDHNAIVVRCAHRSAGAVVDVDLRVVSPADDAIADSDRDRAVVAIGAQGALIALVDPRGAVQHAARLLAARDQDTARTRPAADRRQRRFT